MLDELGYLPICFLKMLFSLERAQVRSISFCVCKSTPLQTPKITLIHRGVGAARSCSVCIIDNLMQEIFLNESVKELPETIAAVPLSHGSFFTKIVPWLTLCFLSVFNRFCWAACNTSHTMGAVLTPRRFAVVDLYIIQRAAI